MSYLINQKRELPHPQAFALYKLDEFPESSVMAGQPRKTFLDFYPTVEDAQEEYPSASLSHPAAEPQPSYNHLPPDPDPPVGTPGV